LSGKPNPKDKKFLQRIAGKPALGAPPTPRPLPKEHPARELFRILPEEPQQELEIHNYIPTVKLAEPEPATAVSGDEKARATPPQSEVNEPVASTPEPPALPLTEIAPAISSGVFETAPVPLPAPGALSATSFDTFYAQWKDALHLHKGEIKVLRVLFSQTHEIGRSECRTTQTTLASSSELQKRQCQNVVASLIKRGLIDKVDLENKDNNRGLIIRVYLNPYDRTPSSK
jgi:hypothetical protein